MLALNPERSTLQIPASSHGGENPGFRVKFYIQILVLHLATCVTLGKLIHFSGPRFLDL